MKLTGVEHDGARRAGNRPAREGDADDPRAVAARTEDARVVCIQIGVEIERTGVFAGCRRQGQTRTGCAGNERRHAIERVFAVGRRAGLFAGSTQVKDVRFLHRPQHFLRCQRGQLGHTGICRCVAIRLGCALFSAHIG